MNFLSKMKIKTKLLVFFLIVGILPLIAMGIISYQKASDSLKNETVNKLTAIGQIKKANLENFFFERGGDVQVLADDPYIVRAIKDLDKYNEEAKAKGLRGMDMMNYAPYKMVHDVYHPFFKNYMDKYGYYDVFLLDPEEGDVFYTVCKENDYGSIASRENTGLTEAWESALSGDVQVTDIARYAPSNNLPAMFIAAPIKENGKDIGVLAFQVPLDAINKIMNERSGMGESGETYVLGERDFLFRSDSRFIGDKAVENAKEDRAIKSTILNLKNACETARDAASGGKGCFVTKDYRGIKVFSAYDRVNLGDFNWLILAEIDEEEALQAARALFTSVIIIAIIAIAAVLFIAFLIAGNITKALKTLTDQAVDISDAVSGGNIEKRSDVESVDNEFQPILKGVNGILENFSAPVKEVMGVMNGVSHNDLSQRVKSNYKGDFGNFKQNINQAIDNLENTFNQQQDTQKVVAELIEAAKDGKLDKRAEMGTSEGEFRKLREGINEMLESVVNPINEAGATMESAANKDLKKRITGNYKGEFARLKDNINEAINNLDTALQQVASGVTQVASASQTISSGSQQLAEGSNEQASSLEEVSSSLEEMASMTKTNSENANQARNLASEANKNAGEGGESMKKMSIAMEKIKESSNQTAKIVKTIDEIAMQTNLLALNAAVEAARAGEAGRGFAVVAEEVRNLAQRSAEAAKNTADMIQESVDNAEGGVSITNDVAKSLETILEGNKKVNDLISEIAAASEEQSKGIEQVNTAVAQMDKVTQQNAANSEESASSSEELSSQAEELQGMISQFQLSGDNELKKKL